MKLGGMSFHTPAAFFAELEEILGDIRSTEWVEVFDEWKDHLKRSIDAESEYL
jgi:hypothetical protein